MSGEQPTPYDWHEQQDFADATNPPIAGELPITPLKDAQTPGEVIRHPDFKWSETRLVQYGAIALAVVAFTYGYKHLVVGDGLPADSGPAACAAPTPQAVKAVDALFSKPGRGDDVYTAAQQSGVHIVGNDYEGFYGGTSSSAPANDIESANGYLSQFGITIQDGVPAGKDDGLYNPTRAELNHDLDNNLEAITGPFGEIPLELAHLTGLKKIILMDNPQVNVQYTWDSPQTLVWNIYGEPDPLAMPDALYGGIDTEECYVDDQNSDAHYAALNGRDIYGAASNHAGLLSLDHFSTQGYDGDEDIDVANSLVTNNPEVAASYRTATQTGNYDRLCYLVNHYDEQIVVATQEGFEGSETDKDDVGGMLMDLGLGSENYSALLNPHSPDLRKKALFLLGRLYDQNPKVVKYIADFSERGPDYELRNCPQVIK